MHRRDMKLMMIVVRIRQPLRQVTGMMVENIGERRSALTGHRVIDPCALEPETCKIANGLGPIVIVVALHEIGEFGGELVRHADRNSLHVPGFLGLGLTRYDNSINLSYLIAADKGR